MYNSVKEYYIIMDERLQLLNSNRNKNLQPEQKDLRLNEAQIQFINTRTNPKTNIKGEGFERSQKRTDDIQGLIRTQNTLPVYEGSYAGTKCVYTVLPADYHCLVSSSSNIVYNCRGIVPVNTSVNVNIAKLAFPNDTTTGNKYTSFKIRINGSVVFDIANYSGFILPKVAEGKFGIIQLVLYELNRIATIPYDVYWQDYNGTFTANSFIFVSKSTVINTATLSFSTTTVNGTVTPTSLTLSTTNSTAFDTKENEVVSQDEYRDMKSNYYYNKNRHEKPMTIESENKLFIMYNPNFVVKAINLEYIRKPRPIIGSINYTCEIDKIEEVIAIAVQNIAGDSNMQNYSAITNENKTKE